MNENKDLTIKVLRNRFKTLMREANVLQEYIKNESVSINEDNQKIEKAYHEKDVETISKLFTEEFLERTSKLTVTVEYGNYLRHALIEVERLVGLLGESVEFETEENKTDFLQLKKSTDYEVVVLDGAVEFKNTDQLKEEIKEYYKIKYEQFMEQFKK